VRLWSVDTGAEQAVLTGHQLQVLSIAWHPDGEQLLSTSDQDGKLLLWNTSDTSPRETIQLGDGVIASIAYSPDSRVLGTSSVGGIVRLRDLAGGPPQQLQGTLPSSQGLAFVGDERLAALSDQGEVVVWNLSSGAQEQSLRSGDATALCLAASDDGALLAAGSTDGTITLWNAQDGAVVQQITGMGGGIVRLALSSDGSLLAAYGREDAGAVAVWETQSGQLLHTFEHAASPTALAFVPASNKLAVADRSGALTFYDARAGQALGNITAEQGWFTTLAFNPNGTLAAAGGVDGIIAMYATADYSLVHGVDTRQNIVALAFRPDGEELAYSGRDGAVRVLAIQQ
jgi:WD40 repeat protein